MYRNYSSNARSNAFKSSINRSTLARQKPTQACDVKKEYSFENDRWDEISRTIYRLKKSVTTLQSIKSVDKENIRSGLNVDQELQRLKRFSLSEDYVKGLVNVLVSHCEGCPSLFQDIAAFNSQFIEDNQFK